LLCSPGWPQTWLSWLHLLSAEITGMSHCPLMAHHQFLNLSLLFDGTKDFKRFRFIADANIRVFRKMLCEFKKIFLILCILLHSKKFMVLYLIPLIFVFIYVMFLYFVIGFLISFHFLLPHISFFSFYFFFNLTYLSFLPILTPSFNSFFYQFLASQFIFVIFISMVIDGEPVAFDFYNSISFFFNF
jgi:hypothetical protein